jgi:hypothetical protein
VLCFSAYHADFSATLLSQARISNAEQLRVCRMLVIGGRDMGAGAVSVHLHHGGPQGAKPNAEVVAEFWPASKSGGRSGVRWQAVCDTAD